VEAGLQARIGRGVSAADGRSEMPNEMQGWKPFPALKFFEINAFVISLMQVFHS
jgi:hypothetical protein